MSVAKAYRILLIGVAGAALTGCGGASHVGFVTSTSIGIGADAATAKTSIAYSRDELFVGPAYPDGGIPPVLGTQTTNGDIINNVQHQSLATGDAAIIIGNEGRGALGILAKQIISQRDLCNAISITNQADKTACDAAVAQMWQTREKIAKSLLDRQACALNAGCKGVGETSLFGTQTDLGLVIQADPKTLVMSKIHFGFQRKEATLAPVSQTPNGEDSFPSMLALFGADYDVGVDKTCWEKREVAPEKAPSTSLPDTGTLTTPGEGASTPTNPSTDQATKPASVEEAKNCANEDVSKAPLRRYGYGIAQVIATGAAADGIARTGVGAAVRTQILKTAAGSDTSGKTQQELDKTPSQKAQDAITQGEAEEVKRRGQADEDLAKARETGALPASDDQVAAEAQSVLAGFGLKPGQTEKFSELKGAYGTINEIIKAYTEALGRTPLDRDQSAELKESDSVADFESMLKANPVLRKFFVARKVRQEQSAA